MTAQSGRSLTDRPVPAGSRKDIIGPPRERTASEPAPAPFGRSVQVKALRFVFVDCGNGVSVPILAENEEQEGIAIEAARRLWLIPDFIRALNGALLRTRNRRNKRLPDEYYRHIADLFLAKTALMLRKGTRFEA